MIEAYIRADFTKKRLDILAMAKHRSVIPYKSERFFVAYELNEKNNSIKIEDITRLSQSGMVRNNYEPDTYELEAIYKFLNSKVVRK